MVRRANLVQFRSTFTTRSCKESEKHEARRVEAGNDERGEKGRRPRDRLYRNPTFYRRPHQPGSRIREEGCARVRYERHGLAGLEALNETGRTLRLVVLVIRRKPTLNVIALEQMAGMARVFREHERNGLEHLD